MAAEESISLVEIGPALDRDEMTSQARIGLLAAMLGYVPLQSGWPDLDI